jgi:ElaB/YqjD/DUF883 family membrane-anchored ribosome-binding protein
MGASGARETRFGRALSLADSADQRKAGNQPAPYPVKADNRPLCIQYNDICLLILAWRKRNMADETTPTGKPKRARKAPSAKAAPIKAEATSAAASASETIKEHVADAKARAKDFTENWREQSGTFAETAKRSARTAASTAKETTGSALHGLSKLIAETAETVDGKLGPQYGDYARQAAETVANAARHLDEKDIDELTEEARSFVRKSPAVAIGAAALVGFVLMRLARGGSSDKS